MITKIKYFLTLTTLLLLSTNQVLADTIVDFSKTGTIEITIKESLEQTPIEGNEITIIEVAEAKSLNHNLIFTYHENIADCEADLSNLKNENLVNEIEKCITNKELPSQTKKTDKTGIVYFDELRLGLYLVKQTNEVEGYSNIDSFLVMIPEVEDNKWVYDITAKPKVDIYKVVDLVIEKKWNSHTEDIPSEVTIELYESDTLIDTIKLNEDNNWTYTFLDIKMSDKYSVKEINIPKGYTPSYKVNNYVFTVTNTDTLPFTGQIFYPIIILSTLGIVLILTGVRIMKNEA